jgi:DNA-binding NarL/FixJ family response regulator
VVRAIRAAHAGEAVIDPKAAARLLEALGRSQPTPGALTPRETQVLTHVARGEANRDVAGALGIAEETVKAHMKSILAKLQANDRTHAVAIALRRGIIEL